MLLACLWIGKILIWDAPSLQVNAYNPRVAETEKQYIRGALLDCYGNKLAYTRVTESGEERVYPYGESCAHVTGYIGKGKTGLELAANSWLLKTAGPWESLKSWLRQEKYQGCDVVTTIDAELQQYIYEQMEGYKGAVVVSEPSTGKILALVSAPSYDPATVIDNWESISQDADSPLYARATQGLYPPGSTFKIITALALYREQKDYFAYQHTCSGSILIGESSLPCYHGSAHGNLTVTQAFARSCNTFFAGLGVALGADALAETAERLHINETFSFALTQSASSVVLSDEDTQIMVGETAIGQGKTLMTPFQLNMLTAAIANEGVLYNPYLMDSVCDQQGQVLEKFLPKWYGTLMSAAEAMYLKDLMAEVTKNGTAAELSGKAPKVWGKTGTAQVGDGKEDHSWFTGFAENEEGKKIAVTVLVENGGTAKRATPLAGKILEYYYSK